MKKVCFICHGNICRSPMAEFLFRDMVEKNGLSDSFEIVSRATSDEETGNGVHRGTRMILSRLGIDPSGKTAIRLCAKDYDKYDLLIGMDSANIRNILRITGGDPENKVFKLLSFAGDSSDISDPWYTGDFESTYSDICRALPPLLDFLRQL